MIRIKVEDPIYASLDESNKRNYHELKLNDTLRKLAHGEFLTFDRFDLWHVVEVNLKRSLL